MFVVAAFVTKGRHAAKTPFSKHCNIAHASATRPPLICFLPENRRSCR